MIIRIKDEQTGEWRDLSVEELRQMDRIRELLVIEHFKNDLDDGDYNAGLDELG